MFGIGVGIGIGLRSKKLATFDTDAQAFFNRVTAAGGVLSTLEKNAVNTLVLSLKSAGIWSSMKAIYPMVGASAAACAQNLKSSSFTGTFTSGWTFASTGVTPNGTSAYMDTNFIPSTNLTFNSASFSIYSRSNFTPTTDQVIGCSNAPANNPLIGMPFRTTKSVGGWLYSYQTPDEINSTINQNFAAMFIASRIASNNAKLYRNSSVLGSVTTNGQTTQPANNFYFGAFNGSGVASLYCNFQFAFAHIGDGLTDTQASNFYTVVQTFNTTLSRQV